MKKNKKKIILFSISVSLLVGIGASSIYFQGEGKNGFYKNLSESIVTKQPNINSLLTEKPNKKQTEQENIPEVQEVQTEKTTTKDNNEKNSSNQAQQKDKSTNKTSNNKKSNVASNKTSNRKSNVTSNKTSNKKSNITSNKTSNKKSNVTSNKTSNTTTKVTGNFNQAEAKKLLSLVNKVRKEKGLKAVTWNSSLENSAMKRAKETHTKFDHTRPNGSRYNTAITTKYKTSGENIAAGQSTATEVFNSWMSSTGHKKNILSPNFTQMGVAVYYDKNSTYQYYWTQLFIG